MSNVVLLDIQMSNVQCLAARYSNVESRAARHSNVQCSMSNGLANFNSYVECPMSSG